MRAVESRTSVSCHSRSTTRAWRTEVLLWRSKPLSGTDSGSWEFRFTGRGPVHPVAAEASRRFRLTCKTRSIRSTRKVARIGERTGDERRRWFPKCHAHREHPLPTVDINGRPVTYQEWDANPRVGGQGRDAERIITGSDGSAWYTTDHYKTFRRIR